MIAEIKRRNPQISKRETEPDKRTIRNLKKIRLKDSKETDNATAVCHASIRFHYRSGRHQTHLRIWRIEGMNVKEK
jgi:hypothetical protein